MLANDDNENDYGMNVKQSLVRSIEYMARASKQASCCRRRRRRSRFHCGTHTIKLIIADPEQSDTGEQLCCFVGGGGGGPNESTRQSH